MSGVDAGAQLPAFPGAEGFGAYARGGRGGDVYHVTNLNSSGVGSFAYGLTTGVPAAGRTIVFDVSGYAHIGGTLRLTASKVTIAGQTAPGDGFGVKDGTFLVSGDDVVIRHMRFRNGNSADAVDLDSGSLNSIFDHVDVMLSNDENMSSFSSPPENMTFQWSINAWGMESHSCGGLWDLNHGTSHHTLWSHNHTRNPKARPGLLDWVNNVTFDWDIGFIMGDSETPATWRANVRGCYFVCPPGNLRSVALEKAQLDRNGGRNFNLFIEDSAMDSNGNGLLDVSKTGYSLASGSYTQSATPFPLTANYQPVSATNPVVGIPVTQDDYLTGYKKIVSFAGPLRLDADLSKPLRDELNTTVINNLVTQKRHHVSNAGGTGASNGGFGTLNSSPAPADSDRDGMPDQWETALGLNAGVDDHNGVLTSAQLASSYFPAGTPAGYTWLEEYLHFLAIPHATVSKNTAANPSAVDIDLRKFTSGFVKSPQFTVANVAGGTTSLSGPGNCLVHFVPTLNTPGRGKFTFTVSDADGSQWTQQFGILISASGVPRDLLWQGGEAGLNKWDSTANNWLSKGAATAFSTNDAALLNNLGSATPALDLSGTLLPGSVTVDASTKNYTLSGAGALAGAMSLTKSGPSTLTINNTGTNSFTGGTTLNEGTLVLGSATSLGNGPVTLTGGVLNIGANVIAANALTVAADASILSGSSAVAGVGAVNGPGMVSVSNTFVFDLRGDMSGLTGGIAFLANGSVRFNGTGGGANAIFDLGQNATASVRNNTGAIQIGALSGGSGSALAGNSNFAVPVVFTIGARNLSTTFAGSIRDGTFSGAPAAVTTVGTGTLTLSGASTYTGATAISAGTMAVEGSLGGTPVTIASGAQLNVFGSLGGTITVQNGAQLYGNGSVGGAVTAAAGSSVSPGAKASAVGNLSLNGGLSLSGATTFFDLSNQPAGSNDKILLGSGTLTLTGSNVFNVRFADGVLGAGIYPLISGAKVTASSSTEVLVSPAPTGTRQTFALERSASGASPGYLQLRVTGDAAALNWNGAVSNVWDLKTAQNWVGGPSPTFFNLDAVSFGDSAPSGNITLAGVLQPRSITVSSNSISYTLGGGGSIGGQATLTKSGAGTLTLAPSAVTLNSTTTAESAAVTLASSAGLSVGMVVEGTGIPAGTVIAAIVDATHLTISQNASAANVDTALNYYAKNTFTGGTLINPGGPVILASDTANAFALGTGPVTLNGGTLSMYDNSTTFNGATFDLVVPAGQVGTFNADSRCDLYGTLSGAGTLNFRVPWVRTSLFTDWSPFTGTINVLTDADGGDFRMSTSYGFPGFPKASVVLADKVTAYYTGTVSSGAGTTIEIGELSGGPLSGLRGGATGGRNFGYRIGGKTPVGSEVTFAGSILEQNSGAITSLVKTGAGIWTLSGVCSYNGGTVVEQGTLRLKSSLTSGGSVQVQGGATLNLVGGTLATDALTIAANATLSGSGTIQGDLNNAGSVVCGNAGAIAVTGDLVNSGTMRFTGGGSLSVSGDFVNNGTLDLLTGAQSLPAKLVNNGVIIDSSSLSQVKVSRSGTTVNVSLQSYAGHSYQLQRSSSLSQPVWSDVGSAQAGSGAVLSFADADGTGNQRFYRVAVSP